MDPSDEITVIGPAELTAERSAGGLQIPVSPEILPIAVWITKSRCQLATAFAPSGVNTICGSVAPAPATESVVALPQVAVLPEIAAEATWIRKSKPPWSLAQIAAAVSPSEESASRPASAFSPACESEETLP